MTPTTNTGWTEVKDQSDLMIRWETPGQTLEGVYTGGKPAGPKGNTLYSFTAPDGTVKKSWELWQLKELLSHVPLGHHVHITYEGLHGKMKQIGRAHV